MFFAGLCSNMEWIKWLENWNASTARKDRMYVIISATLWLLWRYRNNVTFSSQSTRKCSGLCATDGIPGSLKLDMSGSALQNSDQKLK
ncbi:hypothetical protein Tco_1421221 [Tanacetum coccineum]